MFSKLQGMSGKEDNSAVNKGKGNGNNKEKVNEGNGAENKGKGNSNNKEKVNEGNGAENKGNNTENGNNENGVLIIPEMSQENLNKSNSGENIDVLIAGQEGQISPCTIS